MKTALVTGAQSMLGKSICYQFTFKGISNTLVWYLSNRMDK